MRWGVTCPVWRVSCPISSGPCSGGRGKGSKREEVDSAHPWTDTDDRNRHLVLDLCRRRRRRRKGWWTEHLTCLSLEFPICQRDTCQSIDLLGGPTNGWTYLKECWYTPRLIELTPLNSSPSSSWNERGERERKRLDALQSKSHHQYWIIPVQDFDVRSDIIMCGLTGGWNYITSLPLLQSTNQKNFEWNKGRQANDARQLCLYFNLLLLLLLPSFFFSFLIANLSYIFVGRRRHLLCCSFVTVIWGRLYSPLHVVCVQEGRREEEVVEGVKEWRHNKNIWRVITVDHTLLQH